MCALQSHPLLKYIRLKSYFQILCECDTPLLYKLFPSFLLYYVDGLAMPTVWRQIKYSNKSQIQKSTYTLTQCNNFKINFIKKTQQGKYLRRFNVFVTCCLWWHITKCGKRKPWSRYQNNQLLNRELLICQFFFFNVFIYPFTNTYNERNTKIMKPITHRVQ